MCASYQSETLYTTSSTDSLTLTHNQFQGAQQRPALSIGISYSYSQSPLTTTKLAALVPLLDSSTLTNNHIQGAQQRPELCIGTSYSYSQSTLTVTQLAALVPLLDSLTLSPYVSTNLLVHISASSINVSVI